MFYQYATQHATRKCTRDIGFEMKLTYAFRSNVALKVLIDHIASYDTKMRYECGVWDLNIGGVFWANNIRYPIELDFNSNTACLKYYIFDHFVFYNCT